MASKAPAPYIYDIDPEAGLALARAWGRVTGEQMVEMVETVHGDPRWRHDFDAVWDCSAVDAHAVAPTEVPQIVSAAVEGETGRDVMVETGGLIDSAISQLIAAYCRRKGKDVTVERSLDAALAALGYDALPAGLRDLAGRPI